MQMSESEKGEAIVMASLGLLGGRKSFSENIADAARTGMNTRRELLDRRYADEEGVRRDALDMGFRMLQGQKGDLDERNAAAQRAAEGRRQVIADQLGGVQALAGYDKGMRGEAREDEKLALDRAYKTAMAGRAGGGERDPMAAIREKLMMAKQLGASDQQLAGMVAGVREAMVNPPAKPPAARDTKTYFDMAKEMAPDLSPEGQYRVSKLIETNPTTRQFAISMQAILAKEPPK
jgi:hypothetical protein